MAKKRLTHKYWNALPISTRKRALFMIFGSQASANIFAEENPTPKEGIWKMIFSKLRISNDRYYKLLVNGDTYIN